MAPLRRVTAPCDRGALVVTGGNRGIGLEICRQLASNGVLVVLTARDEKKGSRAVEELQSAGLSDVVFHRLDVADRPSIAQLAEFVKRRFGKLDILEDLKTFVDGYMGSLQQSYELAKESLEINFNGTKHVTDCLIPLLLLSRSGRVVNVSSQVAQLKFMSNEGAIKVLSDIDNLSEAKLDEVMSSFMEDFKDGNLAARGWLPVVSAYAVSKALVNAHSRLLARRHPSLVVCCVTPGFVRTGMNYGMGLVSAEEGAAAPVALALRAEPADSGLNFELLDVCEF
ncbi:Salutaridine reductase [Zea mays]|uniref:Salutaridine reductase n=1 Tax=Zea mays TaxID=4577 RepID=A0A3L6F6I7_MAIZE|nr:Salutaridine reductase [Zea mays]